MIRKHITYSSVSDWRLRIEKAFGSLLWDHDGRRLIDFTSGWNVANLGWNHPEIAEAIKVQTDKNTYVPMSASDPVQESYAKKLVDALPKQLDTLCRATGGTEANEQAIKIARAATKRKKIIGFADTFHGETYASISLGYRKEYVADIAPLVPDFIQLEYPTVFPGGNEAEILSTFLKILENHLKKENVAAVLTEAGIITGWGSMFQAPKGYLKAVRDLTQKYETLLIVDEVGTGFARCGKLFACEIEKVTPDIVTFGKAMSNGTAAIAACVTKQKLIEPVINSIKLVSSLGWMPIACAAAEKTLNLHQSYKTWEIAENHGKWLRKILADQLTDHPAFDRVGGVGMEIGLFFKPQKDNAHIHFTAAVVHKAYEKGLLVVQSDDATIQIMPPLNTPKPLLEEGIEILTSAIA